VRGRIRLIAVTLASQTEGFPPCGGISSDGALVKQKAIRMLTYGQSTNNLGTQRSCNNESCRP